MEDKKSYWLELAEYDIDTARAMFDTKRFLYVGFMCHQAVEKSFKAIISTKAVPPRIHNLAKLADISGIYSEMTEEQKSLLDKLDPLNIQSRYPEDRARICRQMTEEICESLIHDTERLLLWIKEQCWS